MRYSQRTTSNVVVAIRLPIVVDVGQTTIVTVATTETIGVLKIVLTHP